MITVLLRTLQFDLQFQPYQGRMQFELQFIPTYPLSQAGNEIKREHLNTLIKIYQRNTVVLYKSEPPKNDFKKTDELLHSRKHFSCVSFHLYPTQHCLSL